MYVAVRSVYPVDQYGNYVRITASSKMIEFEFTNLCILVILSAIKGKVKISATLGLYMRLQNW